MEVYVDGWDVDKTITLDFHTPDIEFPKHACQVRPTTTTTTSHPTLSHPPPNSSHLQNVRVVGYSETTVTLVVVQQQCRRIRRLPPPLATATASA